MKQFKLRNVFYAALSAVIYSNAPAALAQTETEVPIVRPTPPTMTAEVVSRSMAPKSRQNKGNREKAPSSPI